MVIHALRYSLCRTACGCRPNELTVLTGLRQDFRVPLAMVAIAPLRLLGLLRLKLWMLSKTLRETLTRSRWQHLHYLMDGGIMDEFTCSIMSSCRFSDTPKSCNHWPIKALSSMTCSHHSISPRDMSKSQFCLDKPAEFPSNHHGINNESPINHHQP